ncbi:MAG: STAS domain-containing protein [Thermoguttaceae bacterium]|jgi:anti-sigma B factor antagonist
MGKHLRVKKNADALVVHFLDRDIHAELAIMGLGQELYAVVARPDCLKLVLNFSGVDFLSSAMLGKAVTVMKMMAEKNGVLRLCEMCPNVRLVFKHTCLDRILDIRETEADAIGQ